MTRNRMSRDIDELGDRLSPENLKQEAKSAIKSAAQGAVSNVGEPLAARARAWWKPSARTRCR